MYFGRRHARPSLCLTDCREVEASQKQVLDAVDKVIESTRRLKKRVQEVAQQSQAPTVKQE